MMEKLYTSDELLLGLDRNDPASFTSTWDFKQFIRFKVAGGATPKTLKDRLWQATHDAEIAQALADYLDRNPTPRLVGIMGGHSLRRTDEAYREVAEISRVLTREGFLIVTGGGPGAMEAGHFGAYFASSSEGAFRAGLTALRTHPKLPDCTGLLDSEGHLNSKKKAAVTGSFRWLMAAITARCKADGTPGKSLAIPTWRYGEEPTTPFATSYAKYFQNSIREETLVSEGRAGILFAEGGGGTLREVFQAVESNYYARRSSDFIPMVFVNSARYWTSDAIYDDDGALVIAKLRINNFMNRVFKLALSVRLRDACMAKVRFTTDIKTIRQVLNGHAPKAQQALEMMLTGRVAPS